MRFTLENDKVRQEQNIYVPSGRLHTVNLVVGGVVIGLALSVIVETNRFEKATVEFEPKIEYVHQLVPHEGYYILRDLRSLWQRDIDRMRNLSANWDADGAEPVNGIAISNTERFVRQLEAVVAAQIRLFPNAFGAVNMQLETERGRVRCEMGEDMMSYFVKRKGEATEYHSFETIDEEALIVLKQSLMSLF